MTTLERTVLIAAFPTECEFLSGDALDTVIAKGGDIGRYELPGNHQASLRGVYELLGSVVRVIRNLVSQLQPLPTKIEVEVVLEKLKVAIKLENVSSATGKRILAQHRPLIDAVLTELKRRK